MWTNQAGAYLPLGIVVGLLSCISCGMREAHPKAAPSRTWGQMIFLDCDGNKSCEGGWAFEYLLHGDIYTPRIDGGADLRALVYYGRDCLAVVMWRECLGWQDESCFVQAENRQFVASQGGSLGGASVSIAQDKGYLKVEASPNTAFVLRRSKVPSGFAESVLPRLSSLQCALVR